MAIKYVFVGMIFLHNIMWGVTIPHTFTSGTAAKASEVNENFSTLATKITEIEDRTTYDTEVQANGDTFHINTNGYNGNGSIGILTSKGLKISIDINGRMSNNTLYYEDLNCSGTPYAGQYLSGSSDISENELKANYIFKNPDLSNEKIQLFDVTSKLYYKSKDDDLILLHYKSSQYGDYECRNYSSKVLARIAHENDPSITGINTYPIIIDYGERPKIDQEIGAEPDTEPDTNSGPTKHKVYANNVEIGYTTSLPDSNNERLYEVTLKNYDYIIKYLKKDGTYSYFNSTTSSSYKIEEFLYFLSSDCSGNGYVQVLEDYNTEWWSENDTLKEKVIYNNGSRYNLSNNLYKFTNGYNSYKHYNSESCRDIFSKKDAAYRLATIIEGDEEVTPPEKFDAPITIEGYTEEVKLENLEEAN